MPPGVSYRPKECLEDGVDGDEKTVPYTRYHTTTMSEHIIRTLDTVDQVSYGTQGVDDVFAASASHPSSLGFINDDDVMGV